MAQLQKTGLPNETQSCLYYLDRKKRYCRLERIKGKDFCVQHADADDKTEGENTRIKCPLDPSHTCDKKKLAKHLKKCNVTKLIPKEPWYIPGVNSGINIVQDPCDIVKSLKDVPVAEWANLIDRLKCVLLDMPHPNAKLLTHLALQGEISEAEGSAIAMKKLVQNSSLLAVMEQNGLLISPSNYVEFGAGRGQLTTSIIKAIPESILPSCGFILVDRGTNRRKLDAKYRQKGEVIIKRVRADIKDLSLEHIDLLQLQQNQPSVAVSKHLCGSATDFTLRCIVQTASDPGFHGGVIAVCCHHRCEWLEYCGKEYFQSIDFSPRDFSIITLLSSWSVCCFREKKSSEIAMLNGNNEYDFISDQEKEGIGTLCKNIIDNGRMLYMIKNGFTCDLMEYTSKSVTLENVVLVFKNIKANLDDS